MEWIGIMGPMAAEEAVDIPVPVGEAVDAMGAAKGMTGMAAVKMAEKEYTDLNNNPNARENDVRKAYERWDDAKKKYHKLRREGTIE